MIKAVIFDKDGVLIDSEDTHGRSMEYAFRDYGVELSADDKKLIVGRSPLDYLPKLAQQYNLTSETMDELRAAQKEHFYELLKSTPVFHKTIALLKALRGMGIPVALCTSGSKENARATLELIGAQGYFQVITTREDTQKRKPDPDPYLVTAAKLGIDPGDCLVIEDSETGLRSALNAGMKCIVIYNNYTQDHDFTGALAVVESADKINVKELFPGLVE
jgi:HAD superfamily hydrolase (TIGR01509 family)